MKKIGNKHKVQITMIVLLSYLLVACGEVEQTDRVNEVNQKDEIEEYAEDKSEIELEQEPEPEEELEQEPMSQPPLPDNVIEIHLTEDIEYVDEVIPAQYVDDLSLLANLKYTNGTYVYQDGKVYYRRYHEDSYKDKELWGAYGFIPETKKEIVCVDEDGVETVLFDDEGYGDIYLINNRFYMTDGKLYEKNGSTYTEKRLYSVDMQGNDRIDYGRGSIYAVDTDRKIFILEMWEDGTVYYIMNYETGEKKPLFNEPVDYYINIEDYQDGWLYYGICDHEYSPDFSLNKLYAVSIEGEQKEIIEIMSVRSYYGSIIDIEVDEDRVYFILGSYAGSAVDFQGGWLVSVKLDGTDYKAVRAEDDAFYLCHDNGKPLVYFPQYYNGLFGDDDRPEGYNNTLVWDVEADKCYCSGFPSNVLHYYDIRTGVMWRYCSADMGALCSITISDSELQSEKTEVYAIPDDSGKIIRVVMDIEKYITKWKDEEVDLIKYKDFYFADGVLFFKVEYSAYDEETRIGWRDGYRRLHTDIFRLKIGESKAEVLYSY